MRLNVLNTRSVGVGEGATPTPPPTHHPPRASLRRWRVVSLVAVHLLILGHLLHYWIKGRSLTPAVMSESMRTLELGQVTCGVLMFGAALVTTLIFGRFLCGWACHMGALQDFSAWALGKLGLKPQPLRARWLGYAPFAVAGYLFVWPTVKREAALPLAERWWPEYAQWLGSSAPRPAELKLMLTTDDFWAGLPRWEVAVPFLLVCGVLTVVFLGRRGVCRYVCPYGGVLDPAEKLAPVSIAVDPSLCDRCGLCTKACSMGVRVMEETQAVGRIVSSHCVRSLDCVAVCPHGALSLSLGRPALVRRTGAAAKPVYSLSSGEEALVTAAALLTFFIVHGAYNAVPLLMAVGISVCTGGLTFWSLRLVRRPAVSILSHPAKAQGRLRIGGRVVLGVTALATLLVAQTAAVRLMLWQADRSDAQVTVGWEQALAGQADAQQRAAAEAALVEYQLAMAIGSGGWGLLNTPSAQMRMAWLNVVAGRTQAAEKLITSVMEKEGFTDGGTVERARLALSRGDRPGALMGLKNALARKPQLRQATGMLVGLLAEEGRLAEAESLLKIAADQRPWDDVLRAGHADVLMALGRRSEALEEYRRAVMIDYPQPQVKSRYLCVEAAAGDPSRLVGILEQWRKHDAQEAVTAAQQAVSALEGIDQQAAAAPLRTWIAARR